MSPKSWKFVKRLLLFLHRFLLNAPSNGATVRTTSPTSRPRPRRLSTLSRPSRPSLRTHWHRYLNMLKLFYEGRKERGVSLKISSKITDTEMKRGSTVGRIGIKCSISAKSRRAEICVQFLGSVGRGVDKWPHWSLLFTPIFLMLTSVYSVLLPTTNYLEITTGGIK